MKLRHFIIGVAVLVLAIIFLTSTVLEPAARTTLVNWFGTVIYWLWGVAVLTILGIMPFVAGGLFRFSLRKLDQRMLPAQDLESWQSIVLGILGSIVLGYLQILITKLAPMVSGLVYESYVILGWSGRWEVTPVVWGIYGFIAALIAYWYISWADY